MVRRSVLLGMAAVFFLSITGVFAQPAPQEGQGMPGMQHKKMSPEEMAKKDDERIAKRLDELTQRLGLTPAQQQQVKDVLTRTSAAVRQAMQETREKVKGLIEKDRDAIKALLTPEQKAKMEQGPQGAGPGAPGPGGPGPEGQKPQPPEGGDQQ